MFRKNCELKDYQLDECEAVKRRKEGLKGTVRGTLILSRQRCVIANHDETLRRYNEQKQEAAAIQAMQNKHDIEELKKRKAAEIVHKRAQRLERKAAVEFAKSERRVQRKAKQRKVEEQKQSIASKKRRIATRE